MIVCLSAVNAKTASVSGSKPSLVPVLFWMRAGKVSLSPAATSCAAPRWHRTVVCESERRRGRGRRGSSSFTARVSHAISKHGRLHARGVLGRVWQHTVDNIDSLRDQNRLAKAVASLLSVTVRSQYACYSDGARPPPAGRVLDLNLSSRLTTLPTFCLHEVNSAPGGVVCTAMSCILLIAYCFVVVVPADQLGIFPWCRS